MYLAPLALYAFGIFLFFISRGRFRTFLTMSSTLIAPIFILFYIVAHFAAGSASGQGYGAFGFAIIIISTAPFAIPCCGCLSAALGYKFFKRYPNRWMSYVLCGAVLLALPSAYFYYEFIGPKMKGALHKTVTLNDVHPVNFDGKYLKLARQSELHTFAP